VGKFFKMKTFLNIHKTLLFAAFVLLSASTNAQTVTYLWSNGATTPSIDVNPLETTTYYVTITQNGVEYIDSLVVSINQTAAATINGDNSICSGSSTILQASEGASYSWNTGETTSAIEVNPDTNTTYSVLVFDTNGCSSSASLNLSITSNPSISFSPENTLFCNNSASVDLIGGIPLGGVYSGTGVSNGEFNPATAGSGLHPITYTFTDANGCSNASSAVFEVAVCTGVEAATGITLEIRPNPIDDFIYLELQLSQPSENYKLELLDAAGRLVYTCEVNLGDGAVRVQLPEIAPGIYLLSLWGNERRFVRRLVR
jgi:hypothetical protein